MTTTPLILAHGTAYDWGSVKLILFGIPVVGITKISYKTTQKKTNEYGFGRLPIERGYGNIEYTGSLELYLDEWKQICQNAPNGDPLQIPRFEITVSYGFDGTVVPFVDILSNVEFTDSDLSVNQGDTAIKISVPLIIAGIQQFI